MTRISSYSLDNNIGGNDKWIGSDAQNFLITKNFTPNNVANYFNGNNVIDIGTSIRYVYQTLNIGEQRRQGTISFETEIGPQVNFSAITTFLIAKNSIKQNDVSQYLDFLVDGKVLLSKASNINIFGYYKITSLQPWIPNTNFFVVTVDFLAGNGFIYEDLDYLISLVDKAQDVITPTLQSVVNAGNGISNFGGTGIASIQSTNFTSGRTLYLNDNSYPTIRLVDNGNASHNLTIDLDTINLNGTSYNWSTIVSGGTQNLQDVTDIGSITTNTITVGGITSGNLYSDGYTFGISDKYDATYNLYYLPFSYLQITNGVESVYIYHDASIGFQAPSGYATLRSDLLTGVRTLQLPDASGTLALLSNIPIIPTVGTWGALNYPTWTTGTPFVKMTAVGTFALDTTTYYPYPIGTISQYIRGDGSLATFPSVATPTLQQVVEQGPFVQNLTIILSNTGNDFQLILNETGEADIRFINVVLNQLTKIDTNGIYLGTLGYSDYVIINKGGVNVNSVNYAYPTGPSSPLATLLDIPSYTTPTLQEVTDVVPNGNVTTNAIYSNLGFYVSDGFFNYGIQDDSTIVSRDTIVINNSILNKTGSLAVELITENRAYNLPDANGTIALTSDIAPQTLQQVTDEGNETDNFIQSYQYFIAPNYRSASDDWTFKDSLGNDVFTFSSSGDHPASFSKLMLNTARNYELPDASGTIALLSDIPLPSERRNANNSTNNNINYCGTAPNGSSESSAVWTIKRLTIGASGSITIATATNVAWTNRESATYT